MSQSLLCQQHYYKFLSSQSWVCNCVFAVGALTDIPPWTGVALHTYYLASTDFVGFFRIKKQRLTQNCNEKRKDMGGVETQGPMVTCQWECGSMWFIISDLAASCLHHPFCLLYRAASSLSSWLLPRVSATQFQLGHDLGSQDTDVILHLCSGSCSL